MPLKKDIKRVMVIGSGPIVIGQAAEFDYAGPQACRALKEEGLEVILVNSNPATIMTDNAMADKIYIEPLTLDVVKRIIIKEKPDSLPEDSEVSYVNGNDNTCEGVTYTSFPAFSVQFHPEAHGGPLDTSFLFDRFLKMMDDNKK